MESAVKRENRMKECPHCKGTTGVATRIIVSYTQWLEWNGKAVSSEEDATNYPRRTTGECLDCGKRVKLEDLKV